MYRMHKKSATDKTSQQQDCIATQTKYWFSILAVLIAVSVICVIAASDSHRTVYSSAVESYPRGGQLQTIASTKCPYCNGILDAQERCNMLGCLIYSPNWGSQNFQVWNAAATKCPYCNGIIDAQGRCNMWDCLIYSPNWGKPSSAEGIPVKKVLIRELASEVAASQGKSSVIIQSVYIGGNAQKAGLKAGDRIVRFNGRKIKNIKQFQFVVACAKPESNVKIKVIRNGEKVKSIVMIGEGEMEGASPPPTNGS